MPRISDMCDSGKGATPYVNPFSIGILTSVIENRYCEKSRSLVAQVFTLVESSAHPDMAEDNQFSLREPPPIDEPAPKRMKLRMFDLVPAQALNCMGISGIESISLDTLKAQVEAGNNAVQYFSEFADKSIDRKGVAISRFEQKLC